MRVSNEHYNGWAKTRRVRLGQNILNREWIEERPLVTVYYVPISGKRNRESYPTIEDGSGEIFRTRRVLTIGEQGREHG